MGKGNKHMKRLKSEKAKVKLKAKSKQLPKGQNVTDTSFKVKKIVIREQLKQHNETEILSKRKLNVKDLLTRLQHHNSSVRQEAVKELKDILFEHSTEIVSSQLNSLLQGVSALSLDKEKDIRRDSFKVLGLILNPVSTEQLAPFCDILISYLKCAMTHIDTNIKEDSLLFLDVLVQNCGGVLARNSHKVLPIFLDMISRLHSETKPGRQLTTTLNSKNTSIKWRIKVLERLGSMFASTVNYRKNEGPQKSNNQIKIVHVDEKTRYVPIYKEYDLQNYAIELADHKDFTENKIEENLDAKEIEKYVNVLMPLMFDSWIEVCPEDKTKNYSELILSNEAESLLKIIVEIILLIIECIDMLDQNNDLSLGIWFKNNFQRAFIKNLLSKFPYNKSKVAERQRRRQEDFSGVERSEECLEQNLALCHIHIWFTCVNNKVIDKVTKSYCNSISEYVNDIIMDWSTTNDSLILTNLVKLLRTLFLKASKIWYTNHISLKEILQTIISMCSQSQKQEIQSQLFMIISDIILDHTLVQLHNEVVFKTFVISLPNMLLNTSIHENTIQMISKVVLRYKPWIQNELLLKQEAIIENAKKIEIIGSEDEKRSRLTICNLFYFFDAQIYY